MQQDGRKRLRRGLGRDRQHGRAEPVRVASIGETAGNGHTGHRQVRGLARPGREPAAGRPELPLQPPDRRLGRRHRRYRCRRTRRSPTTISCSAPTTSPRSTPNCRPTRSSRAPGSGCCTPTTARRAKTSPASPSRPAAGCTRRPRSPGTAAWPTSRAKATCSSGRRRLPPARPSGRHSATTNRTAATTTTTGRCPTRRKR